MTDQALAIRQAIGVEKLGEIMYKSGYWQDTRSQAQAIVKILAGAELDFGPITSMNGIYIIEGKTSMAAPLIGAAIQRSERYRYRVVEHDDKHCTIDFFEVAGGKREKLGTSSFSLEDARTAQLLGKRGQMWEKYPRNMCFSRALTNGARWYCPDIFTGAVYTPDELGAEINESGEMVEPYVPTREQDPADTSPQRMVTSADDRVWKRFETIRDEALKYGVVPPNIHPPIGYAQLVDIGTKIKVATDIKKEQLARDDADRASHRDNQQLLEATTDWQRNRDLSAEAYALGYRKPELSSHATAVEVDERNQELEDWIRDRSVPPPAALP